MDSITIAETAALRQIMISTQSISLNPNLLFSAGRTSPQLDPLTKSPTIGQAEQAATAPPAPVGQRSQAAAAPRPPATATGSQKPPDLLEQRKGKEN